MCSSGGGGAEAGRQLTNYPPFSDSVYRGKRVKQLPPPSLVGEGLLPSQETHHTVVLFLFFQTFSPFLQHQELCLNLQVCERMVLGDDKTLFLILQSTLIIEDTALYIYNILAKSYIFRLTCYTARVMLSLSFAWSIEATNFKSVSLDSEETPKNSVFVEIEERKDVCSIFPPPKF